MVKTVKGNPISPSFGPSLHTRPFQATHTICPDPAGSLLPTILPSITSLKDRYTILSRLLYDYLFKFFLQLTIVDEIVIASHTLAYFLDCYFSLSNPSSPFVISIHIVRASISSCLSFFVTTSPHLSTPQTKPSLDNFLFRSCAQSFREKFSRFFHFAYAALCIPRSQIFGSLSQRSSPHHHIICSSRWLCSSSKCIFGCRTVFS